MSPTCVHAYEGLEHCVNTLRNKTLSLLKFYLGYTFMLSIHLISATNSSSFFFKVKLTFYCFLHLQMLLLIADS